MSVNVAVRCLAHLAMFWQATKATSSKVEQSPLILKVPRGGNASTFCIFPRLQDTTDVSWWREGEKTFLEADSRKQFNINKGRSTFTLQNVSVADAGMYYCQVKSQQQIIGNGSGSKLIVLTPPTPLTIIPLKETSPQSQKLLCKTAAFYPKKLEIFWQRNNMQILTGIKTVINESAGGYYEASSYMEDAETAQGKVVYTCLVSHESLKVPASFTYVVVQESENVSKTLILGCALGGTSIIVLIIILAGIGLKAQRGIKTNSVEAGQAGVPAEQAPVENALTYAKLNMREDKKYKKVRHQEEQVIYSQTKRDGANKLTYATLQLPNSNKTSGSKHNDKNSVYADVKVSKTARS